MRRYYLAREVEGMLEIVRTAAPPEALDVNTVLDLLCHTGGSVGVLGAPEAGGRLGWGYLNSTAVMV